MQISRGTFLILLLFFMTLTPAGNPPKLISPQERAQLDYYFQNHNKSLEILHNSTWDSGYGNLTGLTEEYQNEPMRKGSIIPKVIYEKAKLIWNLENDYDIEKLTRLAVEYDREHDEDDWNEWQEEKQKEEKWLLENDQKKSEVEEEQEIEDSIYSDSETTVNIASETSIFAASTSTSTSSSTTTTALYKRYLSDFWPSHKNPPPKSSPSLSLAYFSNISASLKGDWAKIDEELIPINMPIPGINPPNERTNVSANQHQNYDIYGRPITGPMIDPNQYYIDGIPVKPGNRTETFGRLRISMKEKRDGNGRNRGGSKGRKRGGRGRGKGKGRGRGRPSDICRNSSNSSISLVSMEITMVDTNDDNSNEIRLQGIRIKDTGNFVVTTSSLKFAGHYGLPHFLLDEFAFKDTQNRMICNMNRSLSRNVMHPYYGILEEAELEAEKCEYIVYGHVHSSGLTKEQLQEVEDELANPLGRPHKPVPKLKISAILYSPDCGIAMTVDNLEGEKQELYFIRIRRAIMAGIILLLIQTIVTALQMKDTNTPSTISRVSFYTIGIMAILDGAICLVALVSTFLDPIALPFMAAAFVSFALTSLFEIRYMVLIYKSQMLEAIADARAMEGNGARFVARADGRIENANANANTTPTSAESILPTTNSPRPPPPPPPTTIVEQDERQIVGVIYSRFYFTMLGFVIISLTTSSWPAPLRIGYEYLSITILFSFWIPQIYRNVIRGSRKSFLWRYILSTSILRAIPVLYVCLDTNNVISHRYDPILASVLVGWLWIQILVLIAQSTFGPRFFLPSGMLPALYDYHPVITEEDLETGFNFQTDAQENAISLQMDSSEDSKSDSSTDTLLTHEHNHANLHKNTSMDCAICMNPVQILIFPQHQVHTALTPANMLARRRYMVTPCRHIFHTECMEQWMRTRLQCPVCRNPLPPI